MAETIRLHNLETGERVEVTEESAEKLLERDNFGSRTRAPERVRKK